MQKFLCIKKQDFVDPQTQNSDSDQKQGWFKT